MVYPEAGQPWIGRRIDYILYRESSISKLCKTVCVLLMCHSLLSLAFSPFISSVSFLKTLPMINERLANADVSDHLCCRVQGPHSRLTQALIFWIFELTLSRLFMTLTQELTSFGLGIWRRGLSLFQFIVFVSLIVKGHYSVSSLDLVCTHLHRCRTGSRRCNKLAITSETFSVKATLNAKIAARKKKAKNSNLS